MTGINGLLDNVRRIADRMKAEGEQDQNSILVDWATHLSHELRLASEDIDGELMEEYNKGYNAAVNDFATEDAGEDI